MARKRLPPNDPREWLQRAQSNLARGLTFPYIHDLGRLLTVLAQAGVRVPQYVREADQLTRFAVDARYPGLSSPVTKREHRRAVRIATGVLRWATRQVERLCP